MRAWMHSVIAVLAVSTVGASATAALSAGTPAVARPASASASPDFVPAAPRITDEVTDLRTQSSRTYETEDGGRVTKVFAGSVNYRENGEWRAIDNKLERSADGDLENRANRYNLELPAHLDEAPIKVRHGAASLAFELQDSSSAAVRSTGNSATYKDALPGVDVRYDALDDEVKETLILRSADAPREFRFKLDLSGGLAARLDSAGALRVVGTDGRARFVVPAPIVWQDGDHDRPSGDPVSSTFDSATGVLRVRVDDAWLSAPGRRFPVSVDPRVVVDSQTDTNVQDCTLSSKPVEQASAFCGATADLRVGKVNGYNQRAVVDFKVAARLPDWVTVREAYAAFFLKAGAGTWQETTAHALTRPFVNGQATWNKAASTVSWTTPGGDFNATPASTKWFNASDGVNTWSYWSMPDQVQRWADKTEPDYGFLMRAAGTGSATWGGSFGNANDASSSKRPYFTVDYEPTYGEDGNFSFVYENLPGIQSGVNVASGRLTVHETDHTITEDAPGFALDRFYNSADTRTGASASALQEGWRLGAEPKARRTGNWDLVIETPSGALLRFPYDDATAAYGADRYNNAMVTATSTEWVVERADDGETFTFDRNSGRLTKRARAGEAGEVAYGYDDSGRLSTITAPGNRVTELAYNANGTLDHAVLPDGQTVGYVYTNGRLSHQVKGDATIGYTYTDGRLTQVWSPDGKVQFQYDTAGRVTQLKRVTDLANNTGPTTTFTYYDKTNLGTCPPGSVGRTVETRPDGKTITYCYDEQLFVGERVLPPGEEDPALSDIMVSGYEEEFGVSRAQAQAAMDLQDRARSLRQAISDGAAGPGYGGVSFDNATRRIKVYIKSGTPTGPVQAAIDARGIGAGTDIVSVAYSQGQLEAGRDDVAAALDASPILGPGRAGASFSASLNAVRIAIANNLSVAEMAAVQQAASATSVPTAVVTRNDSSLDLEDAATGCVPRLCEGPLRAGLAIWLWRNQSGNLWKYDVVCTTGFNVRSRQDSKPYTLTAGHCISALNGQPSFVRQTATTYRSIGTPHGSGIVGPHGDYGLIDNSAGGYSEPSERRAWAVIGGGACRFSSCERTRGAADYRIYRTNTSPEGWTVCGLGRSKTVCGRVDATGYDPLNNPVANVSIVKAYGCSAKRKRNIVGGDSGGPVVRYNDALGIIRGSQGTKGCYWDFSAVQQATDSDNGYDVRVETEQPPPNWDPPGQ